mgnify:CR=1 FL=1
MPKSVFQILVAALGAALAIAFWIIVIPPLLESRDVIGAFASGFVNPYASGYSLDAILCGAILFVWIAYERSVLGIKYGWIAIPIAFVPGVATGFALYLLVRSAQRAG